MSEKTQNAFQKYIIPAILAVALIGVILWAAQQKALAESYKNLAKESYVRAYGELTDDLYDMESTLSKLTAVNSPAQYVLLLDEVWRLSGSAVSHMSYLPVSHVDTAELNQFVVRLGDYAHSLTKKAVRGGVMTEEDTNTILQLRDSCAKLAEEYAQTACSALEAAAAGYITDVVTPAETRGKLIAVLEMLAGKRVSRLPKKHSDIQL